MFRCALIPRSVALWSCVTLGVAACSPAPPETPPSSEVSPSSDAPSPDGARLVLLIVVDRLAAEDLKRFETLFQGGLRRLLDEGVSFVNAQQAHAVTATAPGHATLTTGVRPRRHGIIGNGWFDQEAGRQVTAVSDREVGQSPRRLLVPTLGDWLKQQYPTAKVFGASPKDRAAIFLAGFEADGAIWYDAVRGDWTSSAYYQHEDLEWLRTLNEQRPLDAYLGTVWEPLPIDEGTLEAMEIEDVDLGPLEETFPHPLGSLALTPNAAFYSDLFRSPWIDLHLARLAEHLIEGEDLGGDAVPDLLALGFSALDTVGHGYGPNSREVLDTLLRVDRTLGQLFEFVDQRIGLDRVVIGLSADHGVVPVPEFQALYGRPGKRVAAEGIVCLQRVNEHLSERFGAARWILPGPFLDQKALERAGVDREAIEHEAARWLSACPSVERAWTRTELLSDTPDADPVHQLFINNFHPDRSPDFLVQFDEYFVSTLGAAASHGSAWPYDTWVPFIIRAIGLEPAVADQPVRTVDMAPTLATLAGIAVPDGLDGVDLFGLRTDADGRIAP